MVTELQITLLRDALQKILAKASLVIWLLYGVLNHRL